MGTKKGQRRKTARRAYESEGAEVGRQAMKSEAGSVKHALQSDIQGIIHDLNEHGISEDTFYDILGLVMKDPVHRYYSGYYD